MVLWLTLVYIGLRAYYLSSFTDLKSSRRAEHAGEIGFTLQVLPAGLGLEASQPIEPYRFGIAST